MPVALINSTSSGPYLVSAFDERGVPTVNVYQPEYRHFFHADALAADNELWHETVSDTTQALKRLGVDAVLAGSELGVTLAEELAAALGLPHNDLSRSQARRDKLVMARTLERHGIAAPRSELVSDLDDLESALTNIGRLPVVVKPVASGASDGVTICDTETRLREAVGSLLGTRSVMELDNTAVLVQEYLEGPQYSIDAVSRGGRHVVCSVAVIRFDDVDGFPLWRSRQILRELGPADTEVVDYALRCLDALGVSDSASNTEVRLTPRGPRLVEVNARLGGPALPPDVYVPTFGHSPATLLADSILDGDGFHERVGGPYRANRSMAVAALQPPCEGVIRAMPGLDVIRRLPTFHSFDRLPPRGQAIHDRLLNLSSGGVVHFVGGEDALVAADVATVQRMADEARLFLMDQTR